FFFQAEDGIRDGHVTGVQTCALPILAEEFFRAFVTAAGITLHLKSLSGKNGHHMVEASFKGVARALRDAVRVEGGDIPSTKEVRSEERRVGKECRGWGAAVPSRNKVR